MILRILAHDSRVALRTWGRPGVAATAILTLALGIGASTALFSVVHAVLIRPLPDREADRLVVVRTEQDYEGAARPVRALFQRRGRCLASRSQGVLVGRVRCRQRRRSQPANGGRGRDRRHRRGSVVRDCGRTARARARARAGRRSGAGDGDQRAAVEASLRRCGRRAGAVADDQRPGSSPSSASRATTSRCPLARTCG